MTSYIDMSGVENIAVAMVKQARDDFIRGGKILYELLHNIPTYNELIKDKTHITISNQKEVRWMYDAWRFVRDDPYEFFSAGEEVIINDWKEAAITAYYKSLYLRLDARRKMYNSDTVKAREIKSKMYEKRKARAKELYESGISRKAIAKELGVQLVTVHYYLRS